MSSATVSRMIGLPFGAAAVIQMGSPHASRVTRVEAVAGGFGNVVIPSLSPRANRHR